MLEPEVLVAPKHHKPALWGVLKVVEEMDRFAKEASISYRRSNLIKIFRIDFIFVQILASDPHKLWLDLVAQNVRDVRRLSRLRKDEREVMVGAGSCCHVELRKDLAHDLMNLEVRLLAGSVAVVDGLAAAAFERHRVETCGTQWCLGNWQCYLAGGRDD